MNQVAHMFQGQVLFAFSQWLVLLLLAFFGDSAESGKYVFALSVTAPIFMFFELMLRAVRATDHQFGERFRNYLGLRACCLVLAFITTVAVALVVSPAKFWVIFGVLLFRTGESVSNLSFGGFQRMSASDQVGKSLTVKGIITIIIPLLVAWATAGNAIAVAFTMAAISIIWSLSWDLPKSWALNEPDLKLNFSQLTKSVLDFGPNLRIAKRALPLGFDAFISSTAMNMPRYFIEAYFGTGMLGIFGLMSQLAFAIQLLVGAVGHTGVGMLAERYKAGQRESYWRLFNRMLASSLIVGFLAVIVGTLVFPPILGYFLGPTYHNTMLMMCLLIASCLAGGQRTAGRATQSTGSYFWYMAFDIVNVITSIVCSYLLVEQHGLVGGAIVLIATFGAGLLVTLLHTYTLLWKPEKTVEQG